MKVVVTAEVTHRCPYVDEIDYGTIAMTFDGEAPELHKLRAFLDRFRDQKITHEDLTAHVARKYGCDVTSRWTTAGMAVECSA